MPASKQKLARLGATAGVLAASTAAIMAMGGATAASALATPACEEVPGVTTLQAEGSTLQKVAQAELWMPAYNEVCKPPKVNFKYNGGGTTPALTVFGYNGATINKGVAFVGTDEAPTSTQIANAKFNAGGANPVIVPVAQTSIAIVAHLPAGCSITGGITWKDLNKVFAGTIKQWSELETDNAGCGTNSITRVVPEEGSGTTFQFKNYLSILQTTKAAVGPGKIEVSSPPAKQECVSKNWSEIRSNGGSPNLNLAWPEVLHKAKVGEKEVEVGCAAAGTLSSIHRAPGDGGVVSFMKSNVNTIGFAAYSDVVALGATANVVPMENLFTEGFQDYAAPGTGSGSKEANCGGRQYTVPKSTTGLEVDWSSVFGANPNIGLEGAFYPLCTLTYDLSWHGASSGYTTAGYTSGANVGRAVKDYLFREVLEAQGLLSAHGYQPLPNISSDEVLKAARLAAEKIN